MARPWRVVAVPAFALLLVSCQHAEPAPREQPGSAGRVTTPESSGQLVDVIAHPDDDILFMNPDLAAGIQNRQPTVGIYLTGGESDMPDPAHYVTQRQDGTRAAYARLAGVADDWHRQTITLADHRTVEVDQLAARPDVRVVFLNLPEDNDPAVAGGKHALSRMFNGDPTPVNTLVPEAGVVRESVPYTRADVVGALAELFAQFRPTVIRGQDPQPDARYRQEWGEHDHPDHVMTARFTREAIERYQAGHPENRAALVQYRDYNVADAPIDLTEADRARKKDVFGVYVRHDPGANMDGSYRDWTEHSYYRWTRGGSWAGQDGAGRVHAFAVFGSQLAHWTRDAGGAWHADTLPTPEPLRPALTVLRDNGGRLALVAQSADGRRVLVKHQQDNGDWPVQWDDAGNPSEGRPDFGQTGVPTAVFDRDGHLVVLLKDAGGGVSARRETKPGAWTPWTSLGGSDVQDGVSAITDGDGVLHVFAATREVVLHWRETDSGAFEPARQPFRTATPAGPPTTVREPDGRVRAFVRTDDGTFAAADDDAPLWWPFPWRESQPLGTPGGMAGPVAGARTAPDGPQSLVFVRNSAGGVSASRPDGTGWTDLGGPILDQPTAVSEPNGSITLLATGSDGRLLVNENTPSASGLDFRGWRPAAVGLH